MFGTMHPYRLEVSPGGDTVVARFPGARVTLTERSVGPLGAALGCLPGGARGRRLILEIDNVKFVSDAALQSLTRLDRDLQAGGGCLALRDGAGRLFDFFVAAELTALGPVSRPADLPLPAVLVADRDPAVRAMLEQWLPGHGFAVRPATTGWAVLDLYQRDPAAAAAVLLAVNLPGLDGPRTLAALRRLDPEVRCVFLTGPTGRYPEEMLRSLGAAILRKPVTPGEVAAEVRQLFARPGRSQQEGKFP
jgi:two-component system OmpR family response regulator